MTCQHAREIFAELLDRRTAATAHLDARAHLASCPDCQREFSALNQTLSALDAMPTPQPSPRLRKNFYAMLEEEKHSAASILAASERQQRARRVTLWRWALSPIAACALVVAGFFIGRREAPTVDPQAIAREDATERELATMREQIAKQSAQIENMTKVALISMLQQQQQNPANERLQDVLAAARQENPTAKILEDLVLALTLDPSANVRLRALQALYAHADREFVRAGVLAALPREQNPLVQLELIDFVAGTRDRSAAPVLEKIAANASVEQAVRDAARLALTALNSFHNQAG